ncbi:MAG: hypothetical protein HKM93_04855 [Desulfobacteraceae bacterium]|nr:hypothetical protein [Desulfobacteraceae bacterium]
MTRQISRSDCEEFFEYHGNTMIERIQYLNNGGMNRDWLIFDSVEEACDFFNDDC